MAAGYSRGDNLSGGSPAFNAALNQQAGLMGTDISRGMGMQGRGQSVAHQNAMMEGIGNFRNRALAAEQQRQQGLQLGYSNLIGNMGSAGETQTAQGSTGSPFGQALGGVLGLGQLGASMGLFGPVGMGVAGLSRLGSPTDVRPLVARGGDRYI
jgi:hypothetical protein